ncbi:arginase family protein [Microbacterium sp. zg.Y1090]|uniref:arginase family protein n=1 Tax=Microbacterium TaxID=33882 RepID=UPI00214C29CF|nr:MULTISPECIES: arginase family protein [unclassified Microbacterium]MCR2813510.1 arginase family protein [Microbacterium sp. zg.Y1084]MCR2818153.1 arginase family protein [Microbacterium sp. zg.Y1090]MDL5486675.1 arginase family protein [Microbacterium sp. zg-Y1211]WIM27694.1 arginase family protein [Microbacterium sp. zg-Y1090]
MTRFIVVPQWQGSPSARAMLLVDGAEVIAGDLPRSACTRIDIPLEAGESLGTGVHRLSALARIQALVTEALAPLAEPAVVVGGDCAVAVPAIGHAAQRHPNLAVVWLDAHPDLHDPASSPSGAYAGMALRAVLGDGERALPAGAVPAERVVLAGAREVDAAEAAYLEASPLTVLAADALADPDALADAVAATGADAVYVHVDLDVLDPAAIIGVSSAVPFGVEVPQLVASLARLRNRIPLVGASLAGFAPVTPAAAVDDMGAILRVIGALA